MKSVQFNFKGLMCPVFTAFNDDKKRTVNYDLIDKYAMWLKQKGVTAVLVNSFTGEGTAMRCEERKRHAEEWFKVCRKHQLYCIVQIGGAAIADVYDMAEHCEKLGVDAVLCLPELYYKPQCAEDLVQYMRDLAHYCPTRPLLYNHVPKLTHVWCTMPRFCELAEKEIPNFCGIQYVHTDMDEATATLKQGRTVILSWETIMLGGLTQGFDAICVTMLNIHPEMISEIYELWSQKKINEAMNAQCKLNQCIRGIVQRDCDWVHYMKTECNKVVRDFKVGPCRKPCMNSLNQQW